MSFEETPPSLYDILDLKPDASPQEVREAYLRAKAAYNKDSVALYTLVSSEDREEMVQRIEEAYDTLSSADRRREYDRRHGTLDIMLNNEPDSGAPSTPSAKVISIDRVPPMESTARDESVLVPPTTDFHYESAPPANQPAAAANVPKASPPASTAMNAMNDEIGRETEWKGGFLRRVREARRITLEELSNVTKVSRTYLIAIEEENFAKLPAPVFLRGFITQIAKTLRVPPDPVVTAYMARVQQARAEKPGK